MSLATLAIINRTVSPLGEYLASSLQEQLTQTVTREGICVVNDPLKNPEPGTTGTLALIEGSEASESYTVPITVSTGAVERLETLLIDYIERGQPYEWLERALGELQALPPSRSTLPSTEKLIALSPLQAKQIAREQSLIIPELRLPTTPPPHDAYASQRFDVVLAGPATPGAGILAALVSVERDAVNVGIFITGTRPDSRYLTALRKLTRAGSTTILEDSASSTRMASIAASRCFVSTIPTSLPDPNALLAISCGRGVTVPRSSGTASLFPGDITTFEYSSLDSIRSAILALSFAPPHRALRAKTLGWNARRFIDEFERVAAPREKPAPQPHLELSGEQVAHLLKETGHTNRINLGFDLLSHGYPREARAVLLEALRHREHPALAARSLAVAGVQLEDFREATKFIELSIDLDPKAWQSFKVQAEIAEILGDLTGARVAMLKAVALEPLQREPLMKLISWARTSGDWSELGWFIENFLKHHPHDGEVESAKRAMNLANVPAKRYGWEAQIGATPQLHS